MSGWRDFLDQSAPGGRYLPWKEVGYTTGLSRTTAWRLHRRDEFPRPYPISPGRVGYLECEVEAWKAWRRHLGPSPRETEAPSLAKPPEPPPGRPDAGPTPTAAPELSPTVLRSRPLVPAHSGRRRVRDDERQINFDF